MLMEQYLMFILILLVLLHSTVNLQSTRSYDPEANNNCTNNKWMTEHHF